MKIAFVAAMLVLVLLAAPAAAYASQDSLNGKVTLKYGNLYEPVSTYQKTGIDLGIFDLKGHPIRAVEKASPVLNITLEFGSTPDAGFVYLTGKLQPQFNATGAYTGFYTYPLIYTRPGSYWLHVNGYINGTKVDVNMAPERKIIDSSDNMFPAKASSPDAQDAKIAQLEKDIAALKAAAATTETKSSPGLSGFALDASLLGLAAVAATRRQR